MINLPPPVAVVMALAVLLTAVRVSIDTPSPMETYPLSEPETPSASDHRTASPPLVLMVSLLLILI